LKESTTEEIHEAAPDVTSCEKPGTESSVLNGRLNWAPELESPEIPLPVPLILLDILKMESGLETENEEVKMILPPESESELEPEVPITENKENEDTVAVAAGTEVDEVQIPNSEDEPVMGFKGRENPSKKRYMNKTRSQSSQHTCPTRAKTWNHRPQVPASNISQNWGPYPVLSAALGYGNPSPPGFPLPRHQHIYSSYNSRYGSVGPLVAYRNAGQSNGNGVRQFCPIQNHQNVRNNWGHAQYSTGTGTRHSSYAPHHRQPPPSPPLSPNFFQNRSPTLFPDFTNWNDSSAAAREQHKSRTKRHGGGGSGGFRRNQS
jgi:hypothetical protein